MKGGIILLTTTLLILLALATGTPADLKDATVVPPAWASDHGAADWDDANWEAFRADPGNHWRLSEQALQARNGKGPDEWLPPNDQCRYLSRFVGTLERFDLNPGERWARQLATQHQRCYTQFQ
jgi:hypothetical protein